MPPEIPTRNKFDVITPSLIKALSRETDLEYIKYLNLFNNNIKVIENLNSLVSLTTLILSFNEIKVIEGLEACVNLKKLDLNHNFIARIEGIDHLKDLNILNLSNNWISDFNDIRCITENKIPISDLSLKCNPIAANASYRVILFQKLASLKKLDGLTIHDKDKQDETETLMTRELLYSASNSSAAQPEVGTRTASESLAEDSKSQTSTSAGQESSKAAAFRENQILVNPEVLSLNHYKIKTIENLESFTNLRKLTLIDNMIEKIQGLEKCKLLEELCLEKNKITRIEGIRHLQYLKKLDLGSNRIRVIENLNSLENLTQLSLEDNEID